VTGRGKGCGRENGKEKRKEEIRREEGGKGMKKNVLFKCTTHEENNRA
jgi:hypothetical protein